jgi:hypothetical protein
MFGRPVSIISRESPEVIEATRPSNGECETARFGKQDSSAPGKSGYRTSGFWADLKFPIAASIRRWQIKSSFVGTPLTSLDFRLPVISLNPE